MCKARAVVALLHAEQPAAVDGSVTQNLLTEVLLVSHTKIFNPLRAPTDYTVGVTTTQ